jgi:UDP-2,4-diacetamido-2,4,6-trideoxy-beta-L-altropyranose hydrolase
MGVGHFMRCLALADALKQRGARIRFVSRQMPRHLMEMLRIRGHEHRSLDGNCGEGSTDKVPHSEWPGTTQHADAQETAQILLDHAWDWVVVDHYGLDVQWEKSVRAAAKRILVIDDLADRVHDCDVLLDQNVCTEIDTRYAGRVPAHCRLLLGPRYALLRDEFRRLREQARPRTSPVKRVLICFGGVDADNYTTRAITALADAAIKGLQADVVIGTQHPYRQEIKAACADHGFSCHVQTERMGELIAAADLAIGAGGTMSWERCCLGLPTLTLCVADNQKHLVEDAALNGLLYAPAMNLRGNAPLTQHLLALMDNPLLLRAISQNGLRAVDGRGVQRVLRSIGCCYVTIRVATPADSGKILLWRNHAAIRAVSRDANPIERSDHEAWLKSVLADPDRLLLVGERKGEDIGVVRFDIRDGEAEVSIYLAPDIKETGIGTELLFAAEHWLVDRRQDVRTIRAEVLHNNQRSHSLFEAGDYQICSTVRYKRLDCR